MQAKKWRGRIRVFVQPLFIDDRHPAERFSRPIDAPITYTLDERAAYVEHTPDAKLSRKWGKR